MLRVIRGMGIQSFMMVLHYLLVVPFFAARSIWIATVTGVDVQDVSLESCDVGIDLLEAGRKMKHVIVAKKNVVCAEVIKGSTLSVTTQLCTAEAD